MISNKYLLLIMFQPFCMNLHYLYMWGIRTIDDMSFTKTIALQDEIRQKTNNLSSVLYVLEIWFGFLTIFQGYMFPVIDVQ